MNLCVRQSAKCLEQGAFGAIQFFQCSKPTIFQKQVLNIKMTPQEQEQMYALCARIATEKDSFKFMQLVIELNALLEKKELRLKPDADPATHD